MKTSIIKNVNMFHSTRVLYKWINYVHGLMEHRRITEPLNI